MFSATSFDINNHISWSQDLVNRGFPGFYETVSHEVYSSLYPNYPPLILDIFLSFYLTKKPIFDILWWLNLHLPIFPSNLMFFLGNREFLIGLMKLPGIIFDFLLAIIVYLFVKKIMGKKPNSWWLASIFVIFNPIFIYLSSLWGQVESVNLFFILSSIYLLLYSRQAVASLVLFVLSLLIKPTGLIFLPVYLVYFLKTFGWKKFYLSLAVSNFVFILVYLPFYKTGNVFLFPYLSYWQKVVNGLALSYVSNSAFNFWSIFPGLTGVKDQTLFLNLISYRFLGLIIVAIFYLLIIFRGKNFYYSLFLAGFAFIVFSTRMHERYFIYLLPFLFLIALREKKYFIWLIICSIFFFINIYYFGPILYLDLLGGVKNKMTISTLSVVNLFLFIVLFKKILFKVNR